MARVSISEAARLVNVSRGSLYKTYINKGVISVSKDEAGKKYIETSELLRVFGSLQGNKSAQIETEGEHIDNQQANMLNTTKNMEIQLLREQLEKSEQREQQLLLQIDKMTDTLKLLEYKPSYSKKWWQFWK